MESDGTFHRAAAPLWALAGIWGGFMKVCGTRKAPERISRTDASREGGAE